MKTYFNIPGHDQKALKAKKWLPDESPPEAVVLIVHGIGEHSERYNHFANFLTKNGLAVAAYDHRGHGKTDPDNLGFVSDENGFDLLVNDLDYVFKDIQKAFPEIPIILFGHSMGSFITQRFMQLFDHKPAGIIYSGSSGKPPLSLYAGIPVSSLNQKIFGPAHTSRIIHNLVFGAYNKKFKPNRTEVDWLSRDQGMVDLHVDDPECGFISSISLYHQLFSGLKELHSHKPFANHEPGIPVLLISGDHDPVSNMGKGVHNLEKLLISSGIKNITKKLYPGGRHEMLNEINRDEVMNDILEWIDNDTAIKKNNG
jgi:alpha-beta hydrolase superfamily lysophospholipase